MPALQRARRRYAAVEPPSSGTESNGDHSAAECPLFSLEPAGKVGVAEPWALAGCRRTRPRAMVVEERSGLPVAGSPRVQQPWARLPNEVWVAVADLLPDVEVCMCAAVASSLHGPFASEGHWASRATRAWSHLPGLSQAERDLLLQAANGRQSYTSRRSLLRGCAVALCAGRGEASALADLVRHCGGRVARRGESLQLVLIGRGAGGVRPRAPRRDAALALAASWLRASLVAGRRLPPHREGCPAGGSAFSLPRSCIPPGLAAGGALCCHAPRLLEGLLVTSSRVPDREAVAATVQALGGDYTEELTRAHTHLIAEAAEGLKFEYAQAHRIPVVSRAWLDQTLRTGAPMQERFFAVTSCPSRFSGSSYR